MKSLAVCVLLLVLMFPNFSNSEEEICHCSILKSRIFKIFEKYPQRFNGIENGEQQKAEIYFAIEAGLFFPGMKYELVDYSIVYWVKPGDTFSEILQDVYGEVTPEMIKAEQKRQGIRKKDLIYPDDIFLFNPK